jgi:hypothetical protein
MAEKKPEAVVEKAPVETFDAEEIAQNADHLFGYSHDLAATALELAGVKRCTLDDAKQIIKEFAERKVQ